MRRRTVGSCPACGDRLEPTPVVTTSLDPVIRSVTVTPTVAVVFVGDSLTFVADVNANPVVQDRSVRWRSTSSSLTIDSRGVATAVHVGEATVIAAAAVDPDVKGGATVTVIARP